MNGLHQPVLSGEVVQFLVRKPEGVYVDGTVGTGGHSLAIGRQLVEGGRLICLDRDEAAVRMAAERLAVLGERAQVMKANYADLDEVLQRLRIETVDGVLLDLGMSSYQLEHSGRGFSFARDEPLDMRMDVKGLRTAKALVNEASEKELEAVLRSYGEDRRARAISKAIVKARRKETIETSSELARIVRSVFPPPQRHRGKDPATRTFQALRVAVNRELDHLKAFLDKVPSLLRKGGRLAVISYHSLEDRLCKQAMVDWERGCTCPPDFPKCVCGKSPIAKRLVKKGIRPGQQEVNQNPRARSATMRIAERI